METLPLPYPASIHAVVDRRSFARPVPYQGVRWAGLWIPGGRILHNDDLDRNQDQQQGGTKFPDAQHKLHMIFGGSATYESKRKQKLTAREVKAVAPAVPKYLRWSEAAITFDRSDHPDCIPHPGRYPLVLGPIVEDTKLTRVLIDGGSALNLIFAKTLDAMGIPLSKLSKSTAPFHGIIPGTSSVPLGQIVLPVTFGSRENFRTENIAFEVADFDMAFHAIFGRPALAKFMAIPHCTCKLQPSWTRSDSMQTPSQTARRFW